jgi:hypothetical protein
VLARNFTREVEVGLPIQFLLMGGDQLGAWMALFGLLWSGVFLFFPVFNKDKMRVGDLIAGTWVIKAPKVKLMGDIAEVVVTAPRSNMFAFTPQQADAYGIHELHVLEDVLRNSTGDIKSAGRRTDPHQDRLDGPARRNRHRLPRSLLCRPAPAAGTAHADGRPEDRQVRRAAIAPAPLPGHASALRQKS